MSGERSTKSWDELVDYVREHLHLGESVVQNLLFANCPDLSADQRAELIDQAKEE